MTKLEINQTAPAFQLPDSHQQIVTLDDFKGHWLVLFFYPKDNTPGCTAEACNFRDAYQEILALNTKIIGINTDSSDSHQRFISRQQLPFPLLSDTSGKVSQQYGCLFKLGPIRFCKRQTFIINPEGKIARIYRKVSPGQHAMQVIDDLKHLQQTENI